MAWEEVYFLNTLPPRHFWFDHQSHLIAYLIARII